MASGFLYSHTAGAEESKRSVIPDSVSQQIQDNVKVSLELRAYCLLQLSNAVSALCSMSNQIFNVHISDWAPTSGSTFKVESVKHPSAAQFAASDKLRLRALVLADKLLAANHERQKLHRDMVLWYQKLEKPDLAAAQKEKLFSLVGLRDEGLLYPQPGACGAIVWWEKAFDKPSILCGMG